MNGWKRRSTTSAPSTAKTSVVRASLMGSDFIYDKNEGEDFLPFQR